MKYLIFSILSLMLFNITSFAQNQLLDSLKQVSITHPSDSQRQAVYNQIFAQTYYNYPDTARLYSRKKLALAKKMGYLEQEGVAQKYIGITFAVQGLMDSSLYYYDKALIVSEKMKDTLEIAYNLHNISYTLSQLGRFEESLQGYFRSLELKDQLMRNKKYDIKEMKLGSSLENIGIVYSLSSDTLKAYDYFLKAKNIYSDTDDYQGLGTVSTNLFGYHSKFGNLDSALYYSKIAEDAFTKINNIYGLSVVYTNIASTFFNLATYDSSAYYYEKALTIKEKINDQRGIAFIKIEASVAYAKLGKFEKAEQLLMEGRVLAKELGLQLEYSNSFFNLANIKADEGDYKTAYENRVEHARLQNQLFNTEKRKNLDELTEKYESVKKEKEIIRLNEEKALQDLALLERRNWLAISGVGILFLFIVALVQFRTVRFKNQTNELLEIKNKEILHQKEEIESQSEELKTINDKLAEKNEELNQQNEEIAAQRDRLGEQNELIAQINTDLTDSIQYARSIQEAMLPDINRIKSFIPDFFIFFKPRDIVSGDFYWFFEHENQLILVAADCTGHGVPGAFMSMLGNDLLHDTVIGKQITDPAQILSELNKGIKRVLKQNTSANRDGMDMAICLIDKNQQTLTFSGAKNPLFFVENGEPKLIKGTNNPVGGEFRTDADPYVNHQITIKKDTVFYLYSDGFQDQFGGKKGKKFMSNNFRQLLFEMHRLPMEKQEEILALRFNEWKGNHARLDDVLVMGFHL